MIKSHLIQFKTIYIFQLLALFLVLILNQAYEIDNIFLLLSIAIIIIAIYLTSISIGPGMEAVSVFMLIFMGIIPILEEINNVVYWGASISLNEKIIGNFWIILFEIFLIFGYSKKWTSGVKNINIKLYCYSDLIRIILYISIMALYLSYIYNFDLKFLFIKDSSAPMLVESKAEYLFIEYFLRPLIFNFGLAAFFLSRSSLFVRSLILGFSIFFVFPTGIFRFLVGVLYLPLVFNIFLRTKNFSEIIYQKYFMTTLLIFSLIFISPILEVFRGFSGDSFGSVNFGTDYLFAGHYDAYQMFLNALKVDDSNYGFGFLGVVLFFIPRSFWPSKPDNSGKEIAELFSLSYNNVSMPIFGEFFLNFSYFGILLGGLIVGFLVKIYDVNFTKIISKKLSILHLIYFQVAGFFVILMRGSLLSEFAYFISILMVWLIIYLDNYLFLRK
jgi:hypothetical protein